MSYIPKVTHIVGAGGWNSRSPGIVTVNFDPTDVAYTGFVTNLADGTLIIQYAADTIVANLAQCDPTCAVGLYIKACSTCDTPLVTVLAQAAVAGVALVDGAIPLSGQETTLITKGSAAALTLAAPTLAMNGQTKTIISTTAFAHTVTQTSPGFNGGGVASDVATFAAAVGNSISLVASGGTWYVTNLQGVTLG